MDYVGLISALKDGGVGVDMLVIGIILLVVVETIRLVFDRIKKKYDAAEKIKMRQEKIKALVKREDANKFIHAILTGALADLGGDRIIVVECSNGQQTVARLPWRYMSGAYEATNIGIESKAHTIKNELTSLYATFINKLVSNPYVLLNINNRDKELSFNIYELMERRSTTMSMSVKMHDPVTKKDTGFLIYDKNHGEGFTDVELTKMRKLAAELGVMLSINDWEWEVEFDKGEKRAG